MASTAINSMASTVQQQSLTDLAALRRSLNVELGSLLLNFLEYSLCRGYGLYAQSLMIGAVIGAIFGGFVAKVINSTIPRNWRHMLW
ncbi:hypothetical protein RIF29_20507 [Crotalaria pallida]|uniref:Uncharacterized protein n=1 Tax=Crotalaria pallida TaxID=3830 RepID=A0AAN9F9U0_CROPI